jgi:LEA14-like dessication related protein
MKVDKKNLVVKGLAVAGLFFISKYVVEQLINYAYNRITYSFGRPNIDWSTLSSYPQKIRVRLPMTITNKNPIGVNVTNFQGELFYGPTKISNIFIPSGTSIPANGDATITLVIDVEAVQVLNDILNSLSSSGTYSTLINVLRLKGNLETSLYRVPIDTTISLV